MKKNWVAHEKRCSNNPQRKVYTCPICGEAKWYLIGELNTHKRKNAQCPVNMEFCMLIFIFFQYVKAEC